MLSTQEVSWSSGQKANPLQPAVNNGLFLGRFVCALLMPCLVTLSSCRDLVPVEPEQGPAVMHVESNRGSPTARERAGAATIARSIAAAVEDSSARQYLFDALASADGRERKLHLPSFISNRGERLLEAASRNAGIRRDEVLDASRAVRELELYMPVSGHRAKWTTDVVPLVAILLEDEGQLLAYDAWGTARPLSSEHPPAQPVIVAVPLETDLRAQITRNELGEPETACAGLPHETLDKASARCHGKPEAQFPMSHSVAALDGLYLEYMELYGNQCGWECWWNGDPEFEIHARHPSYQGQVGISQQCAGAHPLDANQPGIKSNDYHLDMNSNSWGGIAKLLSGPQLDAANATGFRLELWEDDLYPCKLNAAEADISAVEVTFLGWAILVAGIVTADAPAAIVGFAIAFGGLINMIFSGDDFIGGLFVPQGQFQASSSTNMVIVHKGDLVGRARLKLYDATPPAPGPTTSVQISNASGYLVPLSGMTRFSAWAVDAEGRAAPDRAVAWSSSNGSVISIDAYGWATGNSVGAATITATVDGVASGVWVSVEAYGAPATIQVTPNSLNLEGGQQQALSVRVLDANGFELPISTGSVTWQVVDSGVCTVDGENVVTAHSSEPYWTTMTAVVEGVSSDPVPCSVDGGGAFSRKSDTSHVSGGRLIRPAGGIGIRR